MTLVCTNIKKSFKITLAIPFKRFQVLYRVTVHAKMAMLDLQRYPWNLNLIKNVEDVFVFMTRKMFISVSFCIASDKKCASHFRRETTNKKQVKEFTKRVLTERYLTKRFLHKKFLYKTMPYKTFPYWMFPHKTCPKQIVSLQNVSLNKCFLQINLS